MVLLDFVWLMLEFFLLFIWFWLLISVFGDIFRSDLSGWGKAGWSIFVIVLPLLGVLIYLVTHGGDMQQRAVRRAGAQAPAGPPTATSDADELQKLAQLHADGALSDEEFAAQKAKVLG